MESQLGHNWEGKVSANLIGRNLSYDMVDNIVGFTSFLSTVRVIPSDGEGEGGCKIKWSFAVDPVEGWALEDLVRVVYEAGLQGMAKKMEDSFGN
ncbi:hypothetical protein EUGRSUZ_C02957 [Eucalyptus grandis]|uniref:Uncharacterized protein n=2 Tax=Eucalyptus grandis TaxID=71139 RepID=A0ACC3LHP6_EUCGR|nr:hypothetical protein EUGRSUZ_C02957 [Eucalyptus grandis]